MSDRGSFRSVYSSLIDDPDFQGLSPRARHTLLTLRLCPQAGPAAIFRYYPAVVAAQTGYTPKEIEKALRELEKGGWIMREQGVLWIVNGLRYDPFLRLADPKHLRHIERAVAALPKLGIVLSFCDYYKIKRPFEDPPKPLRSRSTSTSRNPSTSRKSEKEHEQGKGERERETPLASKSNTDNSCRPMVPAQGTYQDILDHLRRRFPSKSEAELQEEAFRELSEKKLQESHGGVTR